MGVKNFGEERVFKLREFCEEFYQEVNFCVAASFLLVFCSCHMTDKQVVGIVKVTKVEKAQGSFDR